MQAQRYFDNADISVMRAAAAIVSQSGPSTASTGSLTSRCIDDTVASLASALARKQDPDPGSRPGLPAETIPSDDDGPNEDERSLASTSHTLPRRGGRVFCWNRRWIREEDIRIGTWEGAIGLTSGERGAMGLGDLAMWCPHADSLKPGHGDFEK